MPDSLSQNNGLQIFNYQEKEVRAVIIDGEPWWVASDVCNVLEIGNSRQALSRLDDDEKNTVILNDGNRGNPNTSIVNEPGLYTLILSSRKKEAKDFKRWVTHKVIPSIRKTGSYTTSPDQPKVELFPLQEVMHDQALKNWNRVPAGNFGVLTEMYSVMVVLTGKGYKLPERSKPDGSVGKAWKKYAKEHYGIHPTGVYNYLDEMDREWQSYTYALEHVRAFRDFLQDVYFIEYYPKYQEGAIKRRARENQRLGGPNKNQQQIKGQ